MDMIEFPSTKTQTNKLTCKLYMRLQLREGEVTILVPNRKLCHSAEN